MRRARRQEKSGYVRSSELCTPATYVVEADLMAVRPELRGHFQRHRAEADRFARLLTITPTLVKLLTLLAPIRGTASPGTGSGRGLQCPRRRLADVLCAVESSISAAIDLGVEQGLLERYAPTRSVAAITARRSPDERLTHSLVKGPRGRASHTHMNVHGVLYLTARGAELMANVGVLSTFVRGQSGRRRVRTGLVGNVLKTLSNPLRTVALRCTAAARKRTPKDSTNPSSLDHSAAVRGSAHAARPTAGLPDAQRADAQLLETLTAASGPDGGRSRHLRGEIDEAAACYARGIGSADHWRPEAWRAASVAGRQHLVAKFQPLAELVQLLEIHRGPMQRAGSSPAAADHRPYDKRAPRPDAWWTGYGSNEHLDAVARDKRRARR